MAGSSTSQPLSDNGERPLTAAYSRAAANTSPKSGGVRSAARAVKFAGFAIFHAPLRCRITGDVVPYRSHHSDPHAVPASRAVRYRAPLRLRLELTRPIRRAHDERIHPLGGRLPTPAPEDPALVGERRVERRRM